MNDTGGARTSYGYDLADRLVSVNAPSGRIIALACYDAIRRKSLPKKHRVHVQFTALGAFFPTSSTPAKVIVMIELVFSACLAASPMECRDVHLTFAETSVSQVMCALIGQVEMAKWKERNPAFRPGRFKCVAARFAGTEI